jgi:hypothetical protein
MDLEAFYAADERRRRSTELEFGREWHDSGGRCAVSWVEDTGELYVMREPAANVVGDAFGDMVVQHVSEHALGVEVLGVVAGRAAVEGVMSGWEDAMPAPDGVAWLRDRVAHAAEHVQDSPGAPSDELPEDKPH